MGGLRYLDKYKPEVLHTFVENYGKGRGLKHFLESLELMRSLTIGDKKKESIALHSLMISRMIVDLNMKLTAEEEDILLASAVCHIIPEIADNIDLNYLLVLQNHIPLEVVGIVELINEIHKVSSADHPAYFERVKQNKIAMLLAIVDRGNVVEQLHSMNSWQVRHYIYDTRHYYIPLCIYAKHQYPELIAPMNILSEKLKNLTEVAEVLMNKYEIMEDSLLKEIDHLREDNGIIRGILDRLEQA